MAAEDGDLFAEDAEKLSEESFSSEEDDDSSAEDSEDEMEKLIVQAADKVTAADCDGEVADGADQDAALSKNEKKKKKMRWKDRKSIFVNQLPYSATDAQILAHFSACAATEDMEVRRVMNKKNGKFRGIAFIDVKTEEAQEKALVLDQSTFSNGEGERTINVRKAVEKGNEGDKELTARQIQKKKAAEASAENIEKLLSQAIACGSALSSDFDDRSRDFLKTVPEAIATAAIEDFCALDKAKVNNRYASGT
jgi:RNA recognition motif-containing protein